MKTMIVIVTTAVLTIAAATSAFAAEATGTIAAVNTKADAITLSDGKVFTLPEGVEAETLKVGERVRVTYSTVHGKMRASKVVPIK
jgi:Cu/Ag efflux protein CusF